MKLRWAVTLQILLLAPLLLRKLHAPALVYQASVGLMVVAGLAAIWMSRKTFTRRDPSTWLLVAFAVLIVFIEIGKDYYSFLSGTPLRALVMLSAALLFASLLTAVMPLVKVLNEARVSIKETRLRLAELEETAPKDPSA